VVGGEDLLSLLSGKRITHARLEKGLTIEDLAGQTGIGISVLQCYENNGILLNMDHLLLISKTLDKSLSYFLGEQITDRNSRNLGC
jgi:transcriptional regulator with XRE-family HTH domain